MNKKEKMIKTIWNIQMHNEKVQGIEQIISYRFFKNLYIHESFKYIYEIKEWSKSIKIKEDRQSD